MIRKTLSLVALLSCLLGLAACVNLKPAPSQTDSFTLGPVSMEGQVATRDALEPIYIIRPQVPTYLESTRLNYRLASGEVKSLADARWAEPLAEGIARAMSLYLSDSSIGPIEGYYPWPRTSPDASRLSLNFQRFGATDSGNVQLLVNWTLKQPNAESKTGQFVSNAISWQVGQPASLVAAYNNALEALALDLEKSLSDD